MYISNTVHLGGTKKWEKKKTFRTEDQIKSFEIIKAFYSENK